MPITTPDRVIFPQIGFTKRGLAEFHADIARWMLPYIANRPLTLVRCQRGVQTGASFRENCRFLPHDAAWYRWASAAIRRVQIPEQKKVGEYLFVDSPEGIVALVQGDVLEIHAWNSSVERLETPDRIVLDLDPGDGVSWQRVVKAALQARDLLASLGLRCWPKLTGGKGVHVVLPFAPEHDWESIYTFAYRIAEAMLASDRASFTLDFSRKSRTRKILIDYKRNHRGAVAVAAYSTRARPNGPVGIPVSWRELAASRSPDAWNVENVRRRLQRLKADPWQDFWECRQSLTR